MHQSDILQKGNINFVPLLFVFVGLVLFSSCSSTETDAENTAFVVSDEGTSSNVNALTPAAPTGPSATSELPEGMTDQQKKRLEEAFAANVQASDGNVHPGMKARPASRPAPDNSEYFSTLADVATETRLFKGHPVLNKVERITSGSQVKLKIYLKNGGVIDADGKSMTTMAVAPASTFMQIGGLPPLPTPTPGPASSSTSKKKQEESAREVDTVPNIKKN